MDFILDPSATQMLAQVSETPFSFACFLQRIGGKKKGHYNLGHAKVSVKTQLSLNPTIVPLYLKLAAVTHILILKAPLPFLIYEIRMHMKKHVTVVTHRGAFTSFV